MNLFYWPAASCFQLFILAHASTATSKLLASFYGFDIDGIVLNHG
jgi:hypothetical protein